MRRSNGTRWLMYAGFVLLSLASAVLLAQLGWWLKTGNWFWVTFLDALDLIDVGPSAWLAVRISEIAWAGLQDIVWYTLAEASLAGLLAVDGGTLVAIGLLGQSAARRRGGRGARRGSHLAQ